jgi:CheY-like chemotaxis protein
MVAPAPSFRLLVVEDNSLIFDMFAYGLRKYFQGKEHLVEIDHAPDGALALKMMRECRYDLAIVDYYLPVLDGGALVESIRSDPRLATIPVVAMSIGGAEAREATLRAGANLFLDKPIVLRDLYAILERLTTRRGTET